MWTWRIVSIGGVRLPTVRVPLGLERTEGNVLLALACRISSRSSVRVRDVPVHVIGCGPRAPGALSP